MPKTSDKPRRARRWPFWLALALFVAGVALFVRAGLILHRLPPAPPGHGPVLEVPPDDSWTTALFTWAGLVPRRPLPSPPEYWVTLATPDDPMWTVDNMPPPPPPDTQVFYPSVEPDNFQAMYESGLSRPEVVAYYRDTLNQAGWRELEGVFLPVNMPDPDATYVFSRKLGHISLRFFEIEGDGCEYRLTGFRHLMEGLTPGYSPAPGNPAEPPKETAVPGK